MTRSPAVVPAVALLAICCATLAPAVSRAADDPALQRHIDEWAALRSGSGPKADITIRVALPAPHRGQLLVGLFDAVTPFPAGGRHLLNAVVAVTGPRTDYTFKDVPPGEYAIAVICDENANGKLDMILGMMPAEPVAASNDATGSYGPPKYAAAKFTLPPEGITMDMTCRK